MHVCQATTPTPGARLTRTVTLKTCGGHQQKNLSTPLTRTSFPLLASRVLRCTEMESHRTLDLKGYARSTAIHTRHMSSKPIQHQGSCKRDKLLHTVGNCCPSSRTLS